MEIKGFITNLGKYNEGELIGKWISFPIDDDDELNAVMREIGCAYYDENEEYVNTGYEEYFFTDWETDIDYNFGEYVSISQVNELYEKLEEWENDEHLLSAACEIWNFDEVIEHSPNDYNLYYDIVNEYDLGYYWAVESGCYDLSKMGNLANYIDYESFGRDIALETDGGFTTHGFIEYVG